MYKKYNTTALISDTGVMYGLLDNDAVRVLPPQKLLLSIDDGDALS